MILLIMDRHHVDNIIYEQSVKFGGLILTLAIYFLRISRYLLGIDKFRPKFVCRRLVVVERRCNHLLAPQKRCQLVYWYHWYNSCKQRRWNRRLERG